MTIEVAIEFGGAHQLYSHSKQWLSSQKASQCGGGSMLAYGRAPDSDRFLSDARAGSAEALGRALEACRGYLLLVAEKKLGADLRAKGGASDLVQDTFLEAQRDFGRFRGTSQREFQGWLRRILIHNLGVFANRYRDTDKRDIEREVGFVGTGSTGQHAFDPPASTVSPSAKLVAREEAEALRAALQKLPDDYRQAIMLRLEGNLTFEQIGHELGCSEEAARKVWVRAMECLRQQWASVP
jgi:RNA polymerase sigma-70 factor, ECF subfamily